MEIFDISVPIRPGMVTWRDAGQVRLERLRRIEDGANSNSSLLALESHTGTHLDAPLHFLPGAAGTDGVPLDACYGPAAVVAVEPAGPGIVVADLEAAGVPDGARRVLLKTRNSRLWIQAGFVAGFVALEADAARWLVDRGAVLVGIDYLSIAPFGRSRETHLELLGRGCVVLEGLDLSQVAPGEYTLCAFPLRIAGGDGSPVRAVLVRG